MSSTNFDHEQDVRYLYPLLVSDFAVNPESTTVGKCTGKLDLKSYGKFKDSLRHIGGCGTDFKCIFITKMPLKMFQNSENVIMDDL